MVSRDEFYPVVDRLSYEERKHFGLEDVFMPIKAMRAVWTGEKRPPRAGEWYLSGSIVEAYKAPNDLTTPFHIARLVKVEEKTVLVVVQE